MTDHGKTNRTQARGGWVVHDNGHALAPFASELAAYRYANPLHAQVVNVRFGEEIPGAKAGSRRGLRAPGGSVTPLTPEPSEAAGIILQWTWCDQPNCSCRTLRTHR